MQNAKQETLAILQTTKYLLCARRRRSRKVVIEVGGIVQDCQTHANERSSKKSKLVPSASK